jgi:hypothetical protein
MASQPGETRLKEARSYLAECVADEDTHGGRSQIWFDQLSDYVLQLPWTTS